MASNRILRCLVLGGLLAATTVAWADVNYQPYEFSQYVGDARWFSKWEEFAYDREPYANTGFWFSFNIGQYVMESAEPATVGADGVSRFGFFGTLGPVVEFNSITTGWFGDEVFEGQDTEIGYIEKNQGWFVRWFEPHNRDVDLVRSDVGVIFNDPQGLLIGFYDADGDGLDDSFDGDLDFGRDGGVIDAGDLVQQGVSFGELQINQRTHMWTVEANHLLRLPRELCGAYWETFCGVRFLAFDEEFNVDTLGGILADSFWHTEVENRLVGPQVGVRWFRTDERWTFSGDARACLAFNFQTMRQVASFGSDLAQTAGGGTDPPTIDPNLHRSRFDRFTARETVNAAHEMEIAPLVEASAQAQFNLTRQFAIFFGVRAMYVDGIGRPGAMIDYTFPTMGFTDNNHQRMFLAGGFVGVNLNR